MRRALDHRARAGCEGRPLFRIDYFDRLTSLLVADDKITRAVDHDRALTDRNPLRRVGRRLDLHDVLCGKLDEIIPAEIARGLERRIHDRAAVTGMGLSQLA